jgi:hypothetical protein
MPINIKSKFLFVKNRKTKSKSKSKPFTQRTKHKKAYLKNKRKNFRKFGGADPVNDSCPICHESFDDDKTKRIQTLECEHRCHYDCIVQFMVTNPPAAQGCPLCKVPITSPQLIHAAINARLLSSRAMSKEPLSAERNITLVHNTPRRPRAPIGSSLVPSRQP